MVGAIVPEARPQRSSEAGSGHGAALLKWIGRCHHFTHSDLNCRRRASFEPRIFRFGDMPVNKVAVEALIEVFRQMAMDAIRFLETYLSF
jgi:hypothetical protein